MKTPIKKIGAAILAASISFVFILCGCSAGAGKDKTQDGSGTVLKDMMPDELPEGISWYDFKEDKGIFEHLSDTIGRFYLIDMRSSKRSP